MYCVSLPCGISGLCIIIDMLFRVKYNHTMQKCNAMLLVFPTIWEMEVSSSELGCLVKQQSLVTIKSSFFQWIKSLKFITHNYYIYFKYSEIRPVCHWFLLFRNIFLIFFLNRKIFIVLLKFWALSPYIWEFLIT